MLTAPESNAPALETIPPGGFVRLVGEPTTFANTTWQPVIDPATGYSGFAPLTDLGGRPVFGGSFVWFATLDSLTVAPANDQDYPPFNKPAEAVLTQCYGTRIGTYPLWQRQLDSAWRPLRHVEIAIIVSAPDSIFHASTMSTIVEA